MRTYWGRERYRRRAQEVVGEAAHGSPRKEIYEMRGRIGDMMRYESQKGWGGKDKVRVLSPLTITLTLTLIGRIRYESFLL